MNINKAVILAGGLGTRLAEETTIKPKPMVEIGSMPILWHIMKIYSAHGINEFIICLGYKGYVIKEYFANYFLHQSDVTFDLAKNEMQVHQNSAEPWRVTLLDTGNETMTGGRLKRIREHLGDDDFCFTYGDGLADIDIRALIEFHRHQGRLATVSATRPPGRFGSLEIDQDRVTAFREKPIDAGGWINGGFFVISPKCLEYIAGDQTTWEKEPLERLSGEGQLAVYKHHGFWQPMDTLREKHQLDALWSHGDAPWKVW